MVELNTEIGTNFAKLINSSFVLRNLPNGLALIRSLLEAGDFSVRQVMHSKNRNHNH